MIGSDERTDEEARGPCPTSHNSQAGQGTTARPRYPPTRSRSWGNGTNESPLHVGAGSPVFVADGRSGNAGHGKVRLGQTVVATRAHPTVGITAVRAASSGISGAPFSELAQAVGIVSFDGAGDVCHVRTSGRLALPTSVWDSVTGETGGLTPAATYYLSNVVGALTTTAPSSSGAFVVQVGVALNVEVLLLSLPAVPRFIP